MCGKSRVRAVLLTRFSDGRLFRGSLLRCRRNHASSMLINTLSCEVSPIEACLQRRACETKHACHEHLPSDRLSWMSSSASLLNRARIERWKHRTRLCIRQVSPTTAQAGLPVQSRYAHTCDAILPPRRRMHRPIWDGPTCDRVPLPERRFQVILATKIWVLWKTWSIFWSKGYLCHLHMRSQRQICAKSCGGSFTDVNGCCKLCNSYVSLVMMER